MAMSAQDGSTGNDTVTDSFNIYSAGPTWPIMMTKNAYDLLMHAAEKHYESVSDLFENDEIVWSSKAENVDDWDDEIDNFYNATLLLTRVKGKMSPAHRFVLQTIWQMQKRMPDPANELQKLNVTTLGFRTGCSAKTAGRYVDDLVQWGFLHKKNVPATATGYPEVWIAPIRVPEWGEELKPSAYHEKDADRKRCKDCRSTNLLQHTTVVCGDCGAIQSDHTVRVNAEEPESDSDAGPLAPPDVEESSHPLINKKGDTPHPLYVDPDLGDLSAIGGVGVPPSLLDQEGTHAHKIYVIGPAYKAHEARDVPPEIVPAQVDPPNSLFVERAQHQDQAPTQQAPHRKHLGQMGHPGGHQWMGMIAQPGMWCRLCGVELERKEA